jgi:hypothetical protein
MLFHDDEELPLLLARWPNVLQADSPTPAPGRRRGDWQFATNVTSGFPVAPPWVEGFFIAAGATADRVLSWAREPAAWMQGYWAADWADVLMQVGAIQRGPNGSTAVNFSAAGRDGLANPAPNARFVGLNLLAELDSPREYYLEPTPAGAVLLHYFPSAPPASWATNPRLSMAASAVVATNVSFVSFEGLRFAHARGVGVRLQSVMDSVVRNCTIDSHGADGVRVTGTRSGVDACRVERVGCTGIHVRGGDLTTLESGRSFATNNTVALWASYKRVYQPAIRWGGVDNVFSDNSMSGGPHVCMLGGGNDDAGVGCVFERNIFERCAFETSDAGAFYTCGQSANAFVGPGNVLRGNVFRHIRNTAGTGVQGVATEAVYLDDQTSSWTVEENSFTDVLTGVAVCGGRNNVVRANSFVGVDVPLFMDNRGMQGERPPWNCSGADANYSLPCIPWQEQGSVAGPTCNCNPAAVALELFSAGGAEWRRRFPALAAQQSDARCWNKQDGLVPCNNTIVDNVYCFKEGEVLPIGENFSSTSPALASTWSSLMLNNSDRPALC